jgi:uncharacterized protein
VQVLTQPLTSDELDRLEAFLSGVNSGKAMNLEELDGFFCALICGPEVVLPSEYLSCVWGSELIQGAGFKSIEEVQDIISLLMRHWNTIAETLLRGEVYLPILFEDENGVACGNDWARGFFRGIDLRKESWNRLLGDKEAVGLLLPMFMLIHEHDPDPKLRTPAITLEKRKLILDHLIACVVLIYAYFRNGSGTAPRRRKKRSRKRKR